MWIKTKNNYESSDLAPYENERLRLFLKWSKSLFTAFPNPYQILYRQMKTAALAVCRSLTLLCYWPDNFLPPLSSFPLYPLSSFHVWRRLLHTNTHHIEPRKSRLSYFNFFFFREKYNAAFCFFQQKQYSNCFILLSFALNPLIVFEADAKHQPLEFQFSELSFESWRNWE